MSTLEDLIAKQACTELVYKMARGIDRCDETLLRSLFWEDATDDHGLFNGAASDFITFVLPMLAGMTSTQHAVCNVLIEVNGDNAAGESYFIAQHTLPGDPPQEMFAAGRYLDRFERRGGIWKFAHRHAVYDWNTSEAQSTSWNAEPMKSLLARGARGSADPSYPLFAAVRG
jgi:hypothetical protein